MSDQAVAEETFAGWAIVEMMGHRRLAGYAAFVQLGGASFLRIDIPGGPEDNNGEDVATQFYSPGSIYCLTPTTEEVARAAARSGRPQPVTRWELERPAPAQRTVRECAECGDHLEPDEQGACRDCAGIADPADLF